MKLRRSPKPHHLLAVLLAVAALLLAGCTDADTSGSGDGASDATDQPEGEGSDEGSGDEGSGDAADGDAAGGAEGAWDMPPMGSPVNLENTSELNLAEVAAGLPQTQTLTRLVLQAGLLPTVRDGGPFTVFAPVEEAFAAVDPDALRRINQDRAQLADVLTLHVVPGELTLEDLKAAAGTSLTTVQGGALLVEVDGDEVVVGGAVVAVPDVVASNGIVHAIASVITAPNG